MNILILNTFLFFQTIIIPPGIPLHASKKAMPKEVTSLKGSGCQQNSSKKQACPSQDLDLADLTGEEVLKVQSYFKKGEELHHDKVFQDSIEKDLQKFQNVFKDPSVQEIMKGLQARSQEAYENTFSVKNPAPGDLYIFVSFSLGEKALLNLAKDAKCFGATLVLRGFKDGSYKKTAQALHNIILKTGQGVIVDPELYSLFSISAVPAFVLSKPFSLMREEQTFTPLHDRLQGHVSVQYALESFAQTGDLKEEAKAFLSATSLSEDFLNKRTLP